MTSPTPTPKTGKGVYSPGEIEDYEDSFAVLASLAVLSEPDSSTEGGWDIGPQDVNPYTGTAGGSDSFNAFIGGQAVDLYTGVTAENDNPNFYTGGQNVDPLSGGQNVELFTGGGGATTASPIVAFSIGTVEVNGSATDFTPEISDVASDTGGSVYTGVVYDNGVAYYQFADISGFTYEIPVDPNPQPTQPTQPQSVVTPTVVPQIQQSPPNAPPTSPTPLPTLPAPAPDPSQTPATPATLQPEPSPPPQPAPPSSAPDLSQTQQPATTLTNSPQPGPGIVPFDPQADSPLAKLLLYGNDTPILDFLTNDANLRVAQNTALGIAAAAGTVATGGLLLDAAPAIGAGVQSFFATAAAGAQSLASAPLAAGAVGASGVVATNPALQEELEEGVESLPALANEIEASLPSTEEPTESVPSTAEQAASKFQDIVRQAQAFLNANKDLVIQLGGSSKGAPISANQLGAAIGQYAKGNPAFARALGGNAMEAVVNAIIEDLPAGEGSFLQISGPNRIDFIGTGAFEGYAFELTTEAGVAEHVLRVYMQAPGAMIFTYTPIIE